MSVDSALAPVAALGWHRHHLDLGCYVVDALDPDERGAFEAHLGGCESCRLELFEFTETSAELAQLAIIGPPQDVRNAMLATIRTVRPLPPPLDEQPSARATTVEPERRPATPDVEPVRRSTHRIGRNRLLLAVAAVASIVALAFGGVVVASDRQPGTLLAAPVAAQRELDLLAAPDSTVRVSDHDGGRFTFLVSKQRDAAVVIPTGLPDPGAAKTYQVWTLRGDRALPNSLVPHAGTGQWLTGSIRDVSGLAVTVEPAGGSAQPTSQAVAQVFL